jgi:hypothetical protein
MLRKSFALFSIFALLMPAFATAATTTVAVAQKPNARQQVNIISSFIDGSVIYGSDLARANTLRTFKGGTLATSTGDLPPLNTLGLPNANDAGILSDNQLFLVGDVRGNENPELTAVQFLFVREHNRLAAEIAIQNPKWTDEQVYQAARKIVIAELQVITYKEFLPALLGDSALTPYKGYKPNINPGIANEFSTGAFRIGHTLINNDIEFLDNDGNPMRDELPLLEAFFNPTELKKWGPDPVLKYLASDNAQEVDLKLIDDLRNFLFGPPGAGGLDLASLNIQRGRDHGLADYNATRKSYGLAPVTSFAQITSDTDVQQKLQQLYGSVNNIDLWVGGLAEDHVAGSSVGSLFRAIIAKQFENLRDGDRFWYERTFSGTALQNLENTRLKDVIERNTWLTGLQDNVFFYNPAVALSATAAQTPAQKSQIAQVQKANAKKIVSFLGNLFQGLMSESLDGSGNNLLHPTWGKAGTALLRTAPSAYADGVSAPAGANRLSPRVISNALSAADEDTPANDRHMSDWIYAWGQFIDHDIDLTTQGTESFDISIPKGDTWFDPLSTGTQIIPFDRSNYDPNAKWTGNGKKNPHRHIFPSF